jgi:PKD repeat protein
VINGNNIRTLYTLKEAKEDKMLRELFRQKLENAEIIPSQSVRKQLMSRLGRREFMRFNPSRFNIWYTGGIVVAGAALALILASGHDKTGKPAPVNNVKLHDSAIINVQNINNSQSVIMNPEENPKITGISDKKSSGRSAEIDNKNTRLTNPKKINNISSPSGAVSSLPDKGLFHNTVTDRNKLQGATKLTGNLIESSVAEGCTPLKVKFRNIDNSCDSCRWTFGDGGYSTDKATEWLFDLPGEYNVMLHVFGSNGMMSVSSQIIKVHPRPVARFEITPENAIIPDDEIVFHNFSSDAVRFTWDFGDGNYSELFEPRHQYRKFDKYSVKLIATSDSGCSDSLIVTNAFSGSGYYIDFPNAFIPNPNGPSNGYYSSKSDEIAQVFHPVFTGVSEYQLRIFSRRGILIFESNDINIGWDGYFKGQLSDPGVYIWKVRGNFLNGESFTKMGDVTLLVN